MFSFVKQPREETTRAVDFSGCAELLAGETIVLFRVTGGTDGSDYKVSILATTNAGHVREADVLMLVRDR